jgi:dolichol-phosphate mannosyltransferase
VNPNARPFARFPARTLFSFAALQGRSFERDVLKCSLRQIIIIVAMKGHGPGLSVVIPTRHEAKTIEAFLRQTFAALEGIPAEVIVVDDSDHDDTPAALQRVHERVGDCLVVEHRPQGSVPERTLGTAVVRGIRLARGELVCVMDADGQHPPEVIPVMLGAARRTGAEYVGGSRYLPGGSAEGLGGLGRRLISLCLAYGTRLAFVLTPIRRLSDPLSGFFLFRRAIVDGIDLRPIEWKISLEVLVRSRVERIAEVPYGFLPREGGESKASVKPGLLLVRHILVLVLADIVARLARGRNDEGRVTNDE